MSEHTQLAQALLSACVPPLSPNTKFIVSFLFFCLDRKTFGQDRVG